LSLLVLFCFEQTTLIWNDLRRKGIGKMRKVKCKVRNARDWLSSKTTWLCPFCNLPLHFLQLMAIKCGKLYAERLYYV